MKTRAAISALLGFTTLPSFAVSDVLTDNFNAPDSANFDTSSQIGRLGGLLASTVQLRSSRFQHNIAGNQLKTTNTTSSEGRVRIHDIAASFANWHDFASGGAGAAILTEGGIRVEFDWTPINNTDQNWVEISMGIDSQSQTPTEPASRVNHAGTDFGILFRQGGGTQYFKNGVATTGGNFTATPVTSARHVNVSYAFASFADGSNVTVNASVDGTPVLTDYVFQWNNNLGKLYMEFGSLVNSTLFDNFSIKTLNAEPDVDADGISDNWEMAKAGNLTDLNGLLTGPGPGAGTGDFDADGLSDLQEYQLSRTAYPNINPKAADSDSDGLSDSAEVNPVAPRPVSNPTLADTDGDGLSDLIETNSGTFVDAAHPGTNPASPDTDGDQFPDGYEVQRGSSPVSGTGLPTPPAGITLGVVTDEISTGISAAETYTHKISGGGAVTINSVALDVLDTLNTPVNFNWDGFAGGKNIIAPINNNTWIPANGNVTGANLTFFGGFTYSGNGPSPGGTQKFTLSGLTAGQTYDLRIFIRKWDNGTVRPSALKFTNGAQVTDFFILEDRPGTMLGNGNDDSAYYISYTYTAAGDTLVMDATVPNVSSANGSFHLYGLTNRVAGPLPPLEFISIVRTPNGSSTTLTIKTIPSHTYKVEYTTNLTTWIELSDAVPATGTQTVYIDTVASNKPRALYRVTDV
ncbi:MAG TPA: hypothetical protein VHM91_09240, partial [Verrucomicrobiales bacterium]|nr:hypothetical protein [Verrucomicrobiales bacterium]